MVIAVGDCCQPPRHLMPEVVVGEIEQIGFPGMARSRPRVDRYPEPLPTPFEQDVIVRTLAPALRPPGYHLATEDAVAPDRHAAHPDSKDDRRAMELARRPFCPIGEEKRRQSAALRDGSGSASASASKRAVMEARGMTFQKDWTAFGQAFSRRRAWALPVIARCRSTSERRSAASASPGTGSRKTDSLLILPG